jgi:predicted nucleic acid-binding protein
VACAFLSGFPQIAVYSLLAPALLFVLVAADRLRRRAERIAGIARHAGVLALTTGLGIAIASPQLLATLELLAGDWSEVPPSDRVRDDARRLVRVHDLRAADAFQLAAARVASDEQPETLPFVTLDERLALAARREGFSVLP